LIEHLDGRSQRPCFKEDGMSRARIDLDFGDLVGERLPQRFSFVLLGKIQRRRAIVRVGFAFGRPRFKLGPRLLGQ